MDKLRPGREKKRILILSDSPMHRDPRIQVQICSLANDHEVTCLGQTAPGSEAVKFASLDPDDRYSPGMQKRMKQARRWLVRAKLHRLAYFLDPTVRQALRRGRSLPCDLVLCNDVNMLPVAVHFKRRWGAKLYLDAHEYTPRQWDGTAGFQRWIPFWDAVLRHYGPAVDHMTTVCEGIAKEYESCFGLSCNGIVFNTPVAEPDLQPSATGDEAIRLVHHGVTSRARKIEDMIELMRHTEERITLDFYLVGHDQDYLQELRDRAADNPRIRFRKPVPYVDICREINQYDLGVYILAPESFNQRHALPNKFFEFIQARLGIAIGPSPEMASITRRHDLGVVSDDFDVVDFARKLNALTRQDVERYKRNADEVAPRYSAEHSIKQIQAGVRRLLAS